MLTPIIRRAIPTVLVTSLASALLSSACADNHSGWSDDGFGYTGGDTATQTAPTSWTGAGGDSYFNDAERASRSGTDVSRYQGLMAGGSLAMYPEYWQLNQYLASQSPSTIISFVQRYQGSVMAEKLVADYAETKAAQGDYVAVRAVAGYITNPDESEACAIALGYNNTGDPMRAYIEKANVWLETPRKQADLCRQLASELAANPMMSNTDRERRLYRMLRLNNNGDIVNLANRLGVAISFNQLMAVSNNPNNVLGQVGSLAPTAANRYLYLYALGAQAKKSVNDAAWQLKADLGKDIASPNRFFDDKTRRYAYRTLGVARMGVNTDIGFSADAVDWFAQSVGEPFNADEAQAYAQAAIRFGRWQDVAAAIGEMDFKVQQEPIWQYWLARAYRMAGNAAQKQQAQQLFAKLAQNNDYYGLLAKDQIGARFTRLPDLPRPTQADYTRLAQDASFNRAFTLYDLGASPSYANREWNWAVRQANNRGDTGMIIAAAQRANDIGWYDRAIFAIDNASSLPDGALAYPMPRQDSVVRYSRQVGIDPAWAYGIMRQESRFNVGAKSNVGAGGLMQIMPDTAKYIARKLGEPYSAAQVATGETNIRYGTFYMADILNRLGGQPVLATAGYNAGPNKARTWQPDSGSIAADQYVETIPYYETRGYVKAVMANTANYAALLGNPSPLSQRMGIIGAKY